MHASTKVKTVVSNHKFRFRDFDDGFLSTSPNNSIRKYEKRVACFNQMTSPNDGQVLQSDI